MASHLADNLHLVTDTQTEHPPNNLNDLAWWR